MCTQAMFFLGSNESSLLAEINVFRKQLLYNYDSNLWAHAGHVKGDWVL